jgi:diguanylate cyclase (GGDEF)-like protein
MTSDGKNQAPRDLEDSERLRELYSPDGISMAVISALAGDRALSAEEARDLEQLRLRRGELFHSDILYALTHQYFAPDLAGKMWDAILRHKLALSQTLGRNVRIVVATLDHLTNHRDDIASPTLIGEAHMSELAGLSMRDGLTDLYNHTSFMEILSLELRAFVRYRTPVALIMLDIDDFKACNDQHGHMAGDQVLSSLAGVLRRQSRDSDICCRYGGEEFAVILPHTLVGEAGEIAERIRIEALEIPVGQGRLTVSAGVAGASDSVFSTRALVERADLCLLQAKRAGKNRVVSAPAGSS